jgi:hypothetical protein
MTLLKSLAHWNTLYSLAPFERSYVISYLFIFIVFANYRVFVGTVSEFCVKHADCPVITIRRDANECPQDPVDD